MARPAHGMDRAVSPVVGVALLALLTVLLALSVSTAVPSLSGEPPPAAQLSVTANASADRVSITHNGGDRLDVTELRVTVAVDGRELDRQPPVPFFAARGFRSGPTGPFNTASPNDWGAGQTASFRIATTNHPTIDRGATVSVTVATDRTVLLETTTTARHTPGHDLSTESRPGV